MKDYAYTSVKRWKVMLLQKLRLHFDLVYSRGEQKLYIILSKQTCKVSVLNVKDHLNDFCPD